MRERQDGTTSDSDVVEAPGGPLAAAEDAQLVAALARDSVQRAAAWRELVSRHSRRMLAVARSFALDAATAEDLVQTAWLRLLERSESLRDPGAVGAWLCTVVRNEARRVVSRRREVPTELGLDRPDVGGPEEELLLDERARALRAAFSQLDQPCQQLLRLVLADPPLSYDEIALVVGRPRGSLGPTRRRCLERLRRWLPEELS